MSEVDATQADPKADAKAAKAAEAAARKAAREEKKAADKAAKEANKVEKPPKIEQHGVTQPGEGTTSMKVWAIANELSAAAGQPARRKDVVQKAIEADINAATASTQYGKWRVFNGLKGSDEPAPAATEGEAPAA